MLKRGGVAWERRVFSADKSLSLLGFSVACLEPFTPEVRYRKYVTRAGEAKGSGNVDAVDVVHRFVHFHMGFTSKDYIVKDRYSSESNGVTHVYLRQVVEGREVFNGDMNLNVKHGTVLSYGDNFYRAGSARTEFPPVVRSAPEVMTVFLGQAGLQPQRPIEVAFRDGDLLMKNIPEALRDARAQLGWIQTAKEGLLPVWDLQLELKANYYHAHASAFSRDLVALSDWTDRARYRVVPFFSNETSFQLETDPIDFGTSPLGWHDTGYQQYSGTSGNNVISMFTSDRFKDPVYVLANGHDYDFQTNSVGISATNLFYWSNKLHDLFYRYGFDERAGNFQTNNFGKGGKDGDALLAYTQDPTNLNNAYFTTPPDGIAPRMQMHWFNYTTPFRDSSLDQSIIIHEYCHGLSTRLTGGPSNSDCLSVGESGGLGEGWGDFIAILLQTNLQTTRDSNFGIGSYSANMPSLRKYLYSTNLVTNPDTYASLSTYKEVHSIGQVWAVILYEIYWNLRDKLGFTTRWYTPSTSYSNTLILQLVIDAMKLQPCRPTFIDARNSLLHAEHLLTNGQHSCELWKAFAKRGLGAEASFHPRSTPSHIDSNHVPIHCI